jgi:SAM-dependent methyltransferase
MLAGILKKLTGITIGPSAMGVGDWFLSDKRFNKLYPQPMQAIAKRHWTPLMVARKAADFLVKEDGVKILDIGSGVGKFCLSAAYYKPNATYYGVEQRPTLLLYANEAKAALGLQNAVFTQGNFMDLNFKDYTHFYFYNSFYENMLGTEHIDDNLAFSEELFKQYTQHLIAQLDAMPTGTRLATYHCTEADVPPSFALVNTDVNGLLKCWIRR